MPEKSYPFPALKEQPRVIEGEFIDDGRPAKKEAPIGEEMEGEVVERRAMAHTMREAVEKYRKQAPSLGKSKSIKKLVDTLM